MRDADCVRFLQWALPKLQKRWKGFRKVRSQVCKRIARRMQELEIRSIEAYQAHLQRHPEEWARVDAACRITISRFYRDRRVFDRLFEHVLPESAERCRKRGDRALRIWTAGCASGEEPYTLSIGWQEDLRARFPDVTLHISATEAQEHMLERARRGCYARGTLKELAAAWIEAAFEDRGEGDEPLCLKAPYRNYIRWLRQDLREEMPDGPFDGILCRNLAFMYFDEDLRRTCLARMIRRLHPEGFLVIGKHDVMPPHNLPLEPWFGREKIYRKASHSKS